MIENTLSEGEQSPFQSIPGGVAIIAGNEYKENDNRNVIRDLDADPEKVYDLIGRNLPEDIKAYTESDFRRKWDNFPGYREKCAKLFFYANGKRCSE